MTSFLKKNRKSSALLCAAMLLVANAQTFASDSAGSVFDFLPSMESTKGTAMTAAKWSMLTFIFVSAARLATRWGDTSEPRYDWEKIFKGEELSSQLFYLWDDGFVGHTGIKPYLLLNKDNQRTEHLDSCWPKGLGGWGAYYHKSVLKGIGATWVIVTIAQVLADSKTTPDNFMLALANAIKKQTALLPYPKFFEAGLAAALGASAGAALAAK